MSLGVGVPALSLGCEQGRQVRERGNREREREVRKGFSCEAWAEATSKSRGGRHGGGPTARGRWGSREKEKTQREAKGKTQREWIETFFNLAGAVLTAVVASEGVGEGGGNDDGDNGGGEGGGGGEARGEGGGEGRGLLGAEREVPGGYKSSGED